MKVKVSLSSVGLLGPHGPYSPWKSPGQNTGLSSCIILQGIFATQGSNPSLPHCRQIIYQLSHQGSPIILKWVDDLPNPGGEPGSPALQVDSLLAELPGIVHGSNIFQEKLLFSFFLSVFPFPYEIFTLNINYITIYLLKYAIFIYCVICIRHSSKSIACEFCVLHSKCMWYNGKNICPWEWELNNILKFFPLESGIAFFTCRQLISTIKDMNYSAI